MEQNDLSVYTDRLLTFVIATEMIVDFMDGGSWIIAYNGSISTCVILLFYFVLTCT